MTLYMMVPKMGWKMLLVIIYFVIIHDLNSYLVVSTKKHKKAHH